MQPKKEKSRIQDEDVEEGNDDGMSDDDDCCCVDYGNGFDSGWSEH